MKRIASVVCAALFAVFALTTVYAGDQDFELVNRTGLTIAELYVSPAKDSEWGEDVLGRDVLKQGETVEIKFSRSEDTCNWDIKIVDEDDDEVVWENFNLCRISKITLQYEGKKPTAIFE
jgi:hypothetical protein